LTDLVDERVKVHILVWAPGDVHVPPAQDTQCRYELRYMQKACLLPEFSKSDCRERDIREASSPPGFYSYRQSWYGIAFSTNHDVSLRGCIHEGP
jgi:hypothetical protein